MTFSPRAMELKTLSESRISNFYTNFQVDEISRVVSVGDGIAHVYGLKEIQAGKMVEFGPIFLSFLISLLVSLILLSLSFYKNRCPHLTAWFCRFLLQFLNSSFSRFVLLSES